MSNPSITFLKNVNAPWGLTVVPLEQILTDIKTGTYRNFIEEMREVLEAGHAQEYKKLKQNLPCWIFQGTFKERANNENFDKSSDLFHYDIDNLEEDRLQEIAQTLRDMPWTRALWRSPSGCGLKGLVQLRPGAVKDDESYKAIFEDIKEDFINLGVELGKEVDKSCKDVTRRCFVSFDPDLYENPKATPYATKSEKARETELELRIADLKSALLTLDASDYEMWIKIGHAIKSMGKKYFDIWSDWSKSVEPHDSDDILQKRWDGFKPQKTSYKVVFTKAGQVAGWENPIKNRPDPGTTATTTEGLVVSSEETTKLGLDLSPKGFILNTAENVYKILLGDSGLGLPDMKFNEMTEREEFGEVDFEDRHYFDVRVALNDKYKISFNKAHALDAVDRVLREHTYNPLTDQLKDLHWDGGKRAESIAIKYLLAEDTPYTKEVTRKWLLGAVYRVFDPGYKFDNAIVLTGNEGVGKSTFIRRLGEAFGPYFGELTTVDEKLAMEKLHGRWIVEIPEMMVTDKHSTEAIKAFVSSTETRVRVAYGRKPQTFKRKFVMAGTSNKEGFLTSGNDRRFWPLPCGLPQGSFYNDAEFVENLPQIWAEVMAWYRAGETLMLSPEVSTEAKTHQTEALEANDDEWKGAIELFLNAPGGLGNSPINIVCRKTIWDLVISPVFQGVVYRSNVEGRRIGGIMSLMDGWLPGDIKFPPPLGTQKGWRRISETASDADCAGLGVEF